MKVDIKVLWKKGIAIVYDCNKPSKFFSYITLIAHTPKFVIIKKHAEPTNPLNIISLILKSFIKIPIKTAIEREV